MRGGDLHSALKTTVVADLTEGGAGICRNCYRARLERED
jgi:hypothetical protein